MKTQPIIKNENMKAIYRSVCRNKSISRARLARDLGLSKPTVSLLVDELIREGFLSESSEQGEQKPRTGRRPVCLVPQEGIHMMAVAHWKSDGCWMDYVDAGTGRCEERVKIGDGQESGCMDMDCRHLPEMTRRTFDIVQGRRASAQKESNERLLGICIVLEGMLDPERCRFISTPLGISW